jgi:hypothetical protein
MSCKRCEREGVFTGDLCLRGAYTELSGSERVRTSASSRVTRPGSVLDTGGGCLRRSRSSRIAWRLGPPASDNLLAYSQRSSAVPRSSDETSTRSSEGLYCSRADCIQRRQPNSLRPDSTRPTL